MGTDKAKVTIYIFDISVKESYSILDLIILAPRGQYLGNRFGLIKWQCAAYTTNRQNIPQTDEWSDSLSKSDLGIFVRIPQGHT